MQATQHDMQAAEEVKGGVPAVGDQKPSANVPEQWGMIYLFARLFFSVRARSEEALKPYGLTPMQFTILTTVKRWDGISSAELSRRFNVTPQTMGEMIVNLERRSLLERGQDPRNRRALRLGLTGEGSKVVAACQEALAAAEEAIFSHLPQEQHADLRLKLMDLYDRLNGPQA